MPYGRVVDERIMYFIPRADVYRGSGFQVVVGVGVDNRPTPTLYWVVFFYFFFYTVLFIECI